MKKRLLVLLAVAMALVIVFSVSSCGNIAEKVVGKAIEKTIESAVGSDVSLETTDDGVKISTDEGVVEAGEGAKVPEEWPANAPVYPDVKVSYAMVSKDDNGNDTFGLFAEVTKGTVKDVYEWHKGKMSGWETKSDDFYTTDGNDSFTLLFDNGTNEALIMAGSDGSVINFTMTIAASTGD